MAVIQGQTRSAYVATDFTPVAAESRLEKAIADIGVEESRLILPPGHTSTLSANTTIPANVTLDGSMGVIELNGFDLTINGAVKNGSWQLFDDSLGGTVTFTKVEEVRPEWWGAARDGVTDDTAAFDSARTASRYIKLSSATYVVNGLDPGALVHYEGVGSRSAGATVLRGTMAGGIFSYSSTASNLIFEGITFEATVEGVTGVLSTSTNYLSNSTFRNCYFNRSLRYGVNATLLGCTFDRCYFHQYGSAVGTQDMGAIRSYSAGALTVNANQFIGCNFYEHKGTAAVEIDLGYRWLFESCIFESMTCPAVVANGVAVLHFADCWVESVSVAGAPFEFGLSTQGTNATFNHCYIVNNGATTWAEIVSLGSASFANFEFCQGDLAGAALTLKGGVLDAGIGYSTLGSFFSNYSGGAANVLRPRVLIAADRLETIAHTVLGIGDTVSHDIMTFTVPTYTAGTQDSFVAVVELSAMVGAVNTAFTDAAFRSEDIRIHITRMNNGAVQASIISTNAASTTVATGGWTAVPVWSVAVVGSVVTLSVVANPQGGSFTGGLRACVVGSARNASLSSAARQLLAVTGL